MKQPTAQEEKLSSLLPNGFTCKQAKPDDAKEFFSLADELRHCVFHNELSDQENLIHTGVGGLTIIPCDLKEARDWIQKRHVLLVRNNRGDAVAFGSFRWLEQGCDWPELKDKLSSFRNWHSHKERDYFLDEDNLSSIAFLDSIGVTEEFRRKKIAAGIEQEAKKLLLLKGKDKIITSIQTEPILNAESIRLHAALGFEPIATQKKILKINGYNCQFRWSILYWNLRGETK